MRARIAFSAFIVPLLVARATSVLAQEPPPIHVEQVSSTADHLVVLHSGVPGDVRRSLFRMDRSEGAWRRVASATTRYDADTRTYQDFAVQVGHEYCYQIIARSSAGAGSNDTGAAGCAVFDAGDTTVRPPEPATDVSVAEARTTHLVVEFTDGADNEDSLVVERRTANLAEWRPIRTFAALSDRGRSVRFPDRDLEMEVRYCYRVRTHNVHGSSVSTGACERTRPLGVGLPDPGAVRGPALITITHPADSVLAVQWIDDPDSTSEWSVYVYESGALSDPVRSVRIRDSRSPVQARQSARFDDLDPGALYCVGVARGSARPRGAERLCESPYGPRSTPADLGPTVAEVPSIVTARPTLENGEIQLDLDFGARGQVVDLVRARSGERFSRVARAGDDRLVVGRLAAGETYCLRIQLPNRFATRYGDLQCAATRAEAPVTPRGLRVASIMGDRIELAWDRSPRAERYRLRFEGERRLYTDHDGSRDGIGVTRYVFEAKNAYTYCFTVEAENGFGRSGRSVALCDVQGNGSSGVVAYSTALDPYIPDEGLVLFHHTVAPGPGPGARLTGVDVIGNAATPYVVQFLKAGSGTLVCTSDPTLSVAVEPGRALGGPGLETLFGAASPEIGANGLTLVACKVPRTPGGITTDPIPVVVRYRR